MKGENLLSRLLDRLCGRLLWGFYGAIEDEVLVLVNHLHLAGLAVKVRTQLRLAVIRELCQHFGLEPVEAFVGVDVDDLYFVGVASINLALVQGDP